MEQNSHQTVTRVGCVGFSMYACGFSVPQMREFCLFTYPPRSKWASSEEMISFLPKSASSVSRSRSENALDGKLASTSEPIEFCMSSYQGFYAKFDSMMSPKCFFLPQQQYSRVYALFFSRFGLSIKMPVSFTFFLKITNIRIWRCFSSSKIRTQFSRTLCNFTMTFKVMSQYFPAFCKRTHNHIRSAEG